MTVVDREWRFDSLLRVAVFPLIFIMTSDSTYLWHDSFDQTIHYVKHPYKDDCLIAIKHSKYPDEQA